MTIRFNFLVAQARAQWAALLLLASLVTIVFVHREGDHLHVGLPYVYLGDEVHYLVALNSVLWDGDVELGNNYARASLGHVDQGIHRAGQMLDHHTYLRSFTGTVHQQKGLFSAFQERADVDSAGRPRPRVKRVPKGGLLPDEYSWHPSYPLYLLAPFLSILPRTAVEPAVIGLIALLTFLAALRFRELCSVFVPSPFYIDLGMLAVFVGTPVVFYSRALFPESVFVILVVLACHSCIVRGHWLQPALYMMLAAALKPPAALLAVPVILLAASVDLRKSLAIFTLVCVGVWFSFFELRGLKGVMQSGTVVDPERLIELSSLAYMPSANLFHPRYGLFMFAPVLLISLVGWIPLSRRFPKEAGAFLAGVLLNFAFLCLISFYGSSYAGRYQVPFVPLLGVGFVGVWFFPPRVRQVLLAAFTVLLVISVAINIRGTLWAT